MDTKLFLY